MRMALLFSIAMTASAACQASEEEALVQVIERFFHAMTARDVDAMSELMTSDGILYGYRDTPEGIKIVRPTHQAYLENLATGEGRLVERFWNPRVMVEDRLATVWTAYDFHVDGKFSHCGINNFSLLKADDGWIITGVVFSIKTEHCEDSPLGPFPAGDPE